jgi:hypothetical protein
VEITLATVAEQMREIAAERTMQAIAVAQQMPATVAAEPQPDAISLRAAEPLP